MSKQDDIRITVIIPRELNERFKSICKQLVPKVTKSGQAHALIRDFVIKHEKKMVSQE